MKLLLHVCCAPCFIYPLRTIRKTNEIGVTAYFFNPNIHPRTEFTKRLESLKKYCNDETVNFVLHDSYEPHKFVGKVSKNLANRCSNCYELRLKETAEYAFKNGFDTFSSSLLVSPHQKHELIKETGEKIAEETGVKFYYEDFRQGYIYGRQKAIESGLYSQKYCGCFYSEFERNDLKNRNEKFSRFNK